METIGKINQSRFSFPENKRHDQAKDNIFLAKSHFGWREIS